ncbi:MAG TPA: uroporphyrinogen decarboxylase [Candidatus Polarisedimenticolaceae bacterium]
MSDLFLRACRGEKTERPPIWIMRQAGRYLPEYRATRAKAGSFVDLCKNPELAAEVTIQPIDILGVDAAILFSDILVPVEPMGIRMDFNPGPVLDPPVRTRADVERLVVADPEEGLPYVYETIRILRRELAGRVPLIGFGAAPMTLAAYLVEGEGSKNFDKFKGMLFSDPDSARLLLQKCTAMTVRYLAAQVKAGAQAIQVFDSWAGILGYDDYREYSLPYVNEVVASLKPLGVPVIYFALDGAHLFDAIRECGADVLGVDWRTPLDEAARRVGPDFVLQGNLDPCVLFSPPETIAARAREVVERGRAARSHIFNLGHGILPEVPVAHAKALVDAVKATAR